VNISYQKELNVILQMFMVEELKRQNSDGNIQSLIDKTPKDIPLKGKKRNQRLSYSQNGTLNLFCEDYHMKSPEVNYGKKRMHFNDVIFKSKVHIG
jgi:hypothetical protein